MTLTCKLIPKCILKNLTGILQQLRSWGKVFSGKKHMFGGNNIKLVKFYRCRQVNRFDSGILKIRPQQYYFFNLYKKIDI